MRGRRYDALLKNISPFRLRRHTALLDRPLQHLPELSCVLMAVNLHRMLYGHFDEFLFIVGGYCDRAFALRRYLSTVDIFPGHVTVSLGLEEAPNHLADFSGPLGVVTGAEPIDDYNSLVSHDPSVMAFG
jgi:hypothetical protein